VPTSEICTAANFSLFDHLVGAGEQRGRNFEAEGPSSAEVDHQLEPRRPLYRQVAGLFALENAGRVDTERAITFVLICRIAHESAGGGELTSKVQRRNRVASRQHHKLRGAREEERIGRDQKRISAHQN
jgi:hypothetical protein